MSGGPARRRAELVRASSDLGRHHGLAVGAMLGALVIVLGLALRDGPRALRAPGPLARPHAGLACGSCHTPGSARATCTGCHESHPSSRSAHRALASSGRLGCSDCHAVHRNEAGLAFAPSGYASFFGTGVERPLARTESRDEVPTGAPGATRFVALVPASACASCHELGSPRDPAAHCVAGGRGFSLCFDEHRRPATASSAAIASRDALVERARLLGQGPALQGSALGVDRYADGVLVALGLVVAGLSVTLARRRRAGVASRPRAAPPLAAERRLPVIDPARCLGCSACVDVCPYDALAVRRYVAVLARPDACCGAGPCAEACPNGSLTLAAGAQERPGPRLSPELEALDRRGVFLAGDVSGGTLIRNALRQGAAVARTVAGRLAAAGDCSARSPAVLDLVVVGAGPAGLAAGLTARRLGLSVVVLDQVGVAASIRRFSRAKLVLDTPPGVEEQLPLWIGDASKEELLERWRHTIRRAALDVREGARVTRIDAASKDDDARFLVVAERPGTGEAALAARYVLLAAGTRGTPRELDVPVPEGAAGRVHYDLSDARRFAGQRCVVVGLGDVAMETALALAEQPETTVTVVHRGQGFRRGSQRNISLLSGLAARGRVRLVFLAQLKRIGDRELALEIPGRALTLGYDALFVHVGGLPPRALLEAAGIASRPR